MGITGKVISIKEADFTPYGRYFNLKKERCVITERYEAYMTVDPPVTRPLKFGITECSNGQVFSVDSMERHLSTEEVLFTGDRPIILSLADSDPQGEPAAEDVVSFLMEPGDLVVLKKGIWHDACHSAGGRARYYFLANNNGDPDEITWHDVVPGQVDIDLGGQWKSEVRT